MSSFELPPFDAKFLPIKNLADLNQAEQTTILQRESETIGAQIQNTVSEILGSVKERGDDAILEYTRKFDSELVTSLAVSKDEFTEAEAAVPKELGDAFKEAYENIYGFHKAMAPSDQVWENGGNRMGTIFRPVDSVAIYVPGGKALYPSTVLMGVVPAKLAGVKNISLISPPQADGKIAPIVLWCARLAGIDDVYKMGGAQSIAGVAYGTETVQKAELVIGPGNAYVAEAKTQLAGEGQIAIDSPAGPSEVIVIADAKANPHWVACDLLAQAEHDEQAASILLTPSKELAEAVRKEVYNNIKTKTDRGSIKWTSIKDHGHILITKDLDEAIEFSNRYAPEHLEIMTEDSETQLAKITSAGSVFLGYYAPVAVGDYYSGPNHILPTGGQAHRYSGLSVMSFMKRITYQHISRDGLHASRKAIELMSKAEGLYEEHGMSIEARFE